MDRKKYLDVVFSLNIQKTLQYLCPPELVDRAVPGMRVLAPLNRRLRPGIIISTGTTPRISRILNIKDIFDEEPLLDNNLMNLIKWITDYYISSPGMALRVAVPGAVLRYGTTTGPKVRDKMLFASPGTHGLQEPEKPITVRQQAVLSMVEKTGGLPASLLISTLDADYRTLRSLENRGLITLTYQKRSRKGSVEMDTLTPRMALTGIQKEASAAIGEHIAFSLFKVLILHGPPGGGKMEIFLHSIKENLPDEKQALILVPELSLTPQLVARLERVFQSRIAVFHSRLSEAQKRSYWLKSRQGEIRVVVGSRSAVFSPLPRIGVIFVCEEHETSYKSEENPRYNARDVAVERGRISGIPVVLSSSAPSLETLSKRTESDVIYLKIPHHHKARKNIKIKAVDLRKEKGRGKPVLSGQMRHRLKSTLSVKGKAILFVNRRGVASAAFCGNCGYTQHCSRCSTTLSYHGENGIMVCRVCGHSESVFLTCPRCKGAVLHPGSPGTKGVESEVLRLFSSARTGRIDRDSISKKNELEKIIRDFSRGEINVLIGTQLLARGIHWPEVSLVGIIDADTALHKPDFRASEHTFQLITQVVGNAGRGLSGAEVIIQTNYPEHYAIQAVLLGDQEVFYRQELTLREEVGFPPFSRLVLLVLEETDSNKLDKKAQAVKKALDRKLSAFIGKDSSYKEVEILGPHQAPMWLKRKRYRQQILLKAPSSEIIHHLIKDVFSGTDITAQSGGGKLIIDVDPVDFL